MRLFVGIALLAFACSSSPTNEGVGIPVDGGAGAGGSSSGTGGGTGASGGTTGSGGINGSGGTSGSGGSSGYDASGGTSGSTGASGGTGATGGASTDGCAGGQETAAESLGECSFKLPIQGGSVVSPSRIDVIYSVLATGARQVIVRRESAGQCADGGWFFDATSGVTLCPSTCAEVQSTPSAQIALLIGC